MTGDILLDENFDLRMENGDLVVGDATDQHAKILILVDKGHIRKYPLTGVGITGYLLDENLYELKQIIQKELEQDGATVYDLEVYQNGKIKLEHSYEGDTN